MFVYISFDTSVFLSAVLILFTPVPESPALSKRGWTLYQNQVWYRTGWLKRNLGFRYGVLTKRSRGLLVRGVLHIIRFCVKILNMDKRKIGPNFINEVIDELKKVTWPSKNQTIRLTTVVILISLIIGIYIGIIDVLLAKGLEFLTKYR